MRRNAGGVIAISLSRILNPADKELPIANETAGLNSLEGWLGMIAENKRIMGKREELFQKKKAVGLLFHAGGSFLNLETGRYDVGNCFLGHTKGGASPYSQAVEKLADAMAATRS